MRRIITLTTDFGTADGYVGEMKGVLASAVPDVDLIDITHDIAPQDVEQARHAVARVWRRFPAGTVHLVVVDPEVGSARAALAVVADGRFFVGPDNGVLSPGLLVPDARAVALPVPATSSSTFHGRDVFAPAAAALARGEPLESLGEPATAAVVFRTPEPVRHENGMVDGEIVHVDRFGNAMTNILGLHDGVVEIGGLRVPLRHAYADVVSGAPVAVVGSTGFIEIAVRDGSAAHTMGLARGMPVRLSPS